MGREHTRAGQYIFLCFTCLIFFVFSGCATLKEMNTRRSAQDHLQRSEELLAQGDYEKALRENQEVLSMVGRTIPGDKALFNMGLIYAHYENPEKDYTKSREFFDRLITEYPRSTLVEQAKMWMDTLGCLENEKQASVALAKQIEALETQTEKKKSEGLQLSGQNYFTSSQKRLAQQDYGIVLKEAGDILKGKGTPNKDQALFNKGLVYAHNGYPGKNYEEASEYFKRLIKEYPESTLAEQARIWVNILAVIQVDIDIEQKKKELEEQVDTALETKKKELENQVIQSEDMPSGSEPTKTGPGQSTSSTKAEIVKQDKKTTPKKRASRIVLLDEGDGTLSSLAKKYYGRGDATYCDLILKANPGITDVRKIIDNQPITISEITPDSYIEKTGNENYKIHIATYYTSESAEAFIEEMGNSEKPLSVEKNRVSSKDTWYRVTMGGFKSREAALQKVNRLVEKDIIFIPPEFK